MIWIRRSGLPAMCGSVYKPSRDTGVEVAFGEVAFLRAGYSGIGIEDSIEGFSLNVGF